MTIAPTIEKYLASKNITYDVIMHEPTMSSNRTAQASGISGDQIAKAVVLRGGGGFILAVLPASPSGILVSGLVCRDTWREGRVEFTQSARLS